MEDEALEYEVEKENMEAPRGCVLPPAEAMWMLKGGVQGGGGAGAVCPGLPPPGRCKLSGTGQEIRTEEPEAVNIEAALPETFKKERTSAGGRIQEESLASKNKESQEKVS